MGLTVRARLYNRANVWYWRVRYWWMDTPGGREARVAAMCLALLISISQFASMAVHATLPPPPDEPVKAPYWWVVQLIIAIVSAIISYALRPKVQAPTHAQQDTPTVDDGQSVIEAHGDIWVDEEFIAAQKVVGRDPIKSKGKK